MFKKRVLGLVLAGLLLQKSVWAAMLPYDYKGTIHVHSKYSHDSKAGIETIIEAAKSAGSDFVIITDHKSTDYKDAEGWYKNTLILVGEERSAKNHGGHYLSFEDVKVIAHPTAWRKPWTASIEGFDAIEVYNLAEDFKDKKPITYLTFLVGGLFFPLTKVPLANKIVNEKQILTTFIRDEPREALSLWDKILAKQKISAIGSVDAHLVADFLVDIPNQKQIYKMVYTHIITNEGFTRDYGHDMRLVSEAIKKGNCYVSFSSEALIFYAKNQSGVASIGEGLKFGRETMLYADTGKSTRIKLYKDGKLLLERENPLVYMTNEPGIYRVETYETRFRDSLLHISNPIYLESKK